MRTFLLLLLSVPAGFAQGDNFAGFYTGISTLSADARTISGSGATLFSTYKPENGVTWTGFAGRHMNDWISFMGSYSWNRNSVAMNSGALGESGTFWEQQRRVTLQTIVGEGLLYFRGRTSRLRPYLSAGLGLTHTSNQAVEPVLTIGAAQPPPEKFSAVHPAFRVAVGIDITIRGGLAFRYSFSETIQSNVTSKELDPPGQRNLANFQNWFGFSYRF